MLWPRMELRCDATGDRRSVALSDAKGRVGPGAGRYTLVLMAGELRRRKTIDVAGSELVVEVSAQ